MIVGESKRKRRKWLLEQLLPSSVWPWGAAEWLHDICAEILPLVTALIPHTWISWCTINLRLVIHRWCNIFLWLVWSSSWTPRRTDGRNSTPAKPENSSCSSDRHPNIGWCSLTATRILHRSTFWKIDQLCCVSNGVRKSGSLAMDLSTTVCFHHRQILGRRIIKQLNLLIRKLVEIESRQSHQQSFMEKGI